VTGEPPVGRLVRETAADLLRHPVPHLLASLPLFVVWMGCSLLFYRTLFVLSPSIYSMWFWLEDELVAAVLYLSWSLVLAPCFAILLPYAPLFVGMMDAQHAWLERGEPLRLTSALPRPRALGPSLVVLAVFFLQMALLWMGVLPGMVAEAVLGFSAVAMLVHGVGPIEGLRMSIAHFARAPLWRLQVALVFLVVTSLCALLVVPMMILPAFYANLLLRTYRAVYGSDTRPRPL
jgi:hypothetical protein